MSEQPSDPRHINNVRARRAADEAEREMYRAVEREIDPQPRVGILDVIKRALDGTP